MTPNRGFEKLVIESVKDGLSLLGESVKNSTLCCLQARFGLSEADIPSKPELFEEYLEELFGWGVNIVIRRIVQNLLSRVHSLGPRCDDPDKVSFVLAVRRVRQKFKTDRIGT